MKIVRHIPNTITSMNLLCGALGVIFALNGKIDIAFYLMLIGAVCDFCDGLSARLFNAYSPMGKELDSLADLISFGLLPSVMIYKVMTINHEDSWFCYLPLIIAVFSGLRLAKFNTDDRQTENFIGLATPACAMICGSFAYCVTGTAEGIIMFISWTQSTWIIPLCSVVLSLLLVSEIPMFSLKFKKASRFNRVRLFFVIFSAVIASVIIIAGLHWSFIILMIFTIYVIYNIIRMFTTIRITQK